MIIPAVLKRRQKSVRTIDGTLALAATAKARPTRNATFSDFRAMARTIESAPITPAVIRATRTCSRSSSFPPFTTFSQMSWAKAADEAMVRPATTARIVAKAMAETNERKISPPSASARSGAARFVLTAGTT